MELVIRVPEGADRVCMLGAADRNLKLIREALGVQIAARDDTVRLKGDRRNVTAARDALHSLSRSARDRKALSRRQVLDVIADAETGVCEIVVEPDSNGFTDRDTQEALRAAWDNQLNVYADGKPITARSANQKAYLQAIHDQDLVFAIGPAGTGKTYLAVAAAVHMLKIGRARKVILVRPAVEAGEKLGFLPGDMEAKVNPYLRPLFDALHDMMDFASIKRFMAHDIVEVVPLAFMRGRTLNNAIIILDEAQNTTKGQMQMFLTRMGQGSKVIVTGDTTQIDLPDPRQSGLIDAARRLRRVPGVSFITLDRSDIVRHMLVQRIVEAYGQNNPTRSGEDASDRSIG